MQVEKIELTVVQATSIDQFCTPSTRKRKLYMHYFLKMPDGGNTTWQYRWIDHRTDPDCLIDWIREGRVYIFPEECSIKEVGNI